jgi:superfamily II DNA or RNA helicase
VRKRRLLILSPTASGKSLIIYLLVRMFEKQRILIIVPTLNLLHQLESDFRSYRYDTENVVQTIFGGEGRIPHKNIIISTWQSIYDMPKNFFNFDVIIVDEVHLAEAKSLKGILEKSINTPYRYGFTGTLK